MFPQRVSQIRPRLESLDGAAAAYLGANYDECLASIYDDSSDAAVALRARCLIRLRKEDDAIGALDAAIAQKLDRDRISEMLTLKGTALICVGRIAEAETALVEARVSAYLSGSAAVEAEAEYAFAILHWSQGRYSDMENDLKRILALPQEVSSFLSVSSMSNYVGSLSEVRAKAFDLLGARAAVREDFDEQASLITMAFEELANSPTVDQFFESRLLLNLAVIARDLDTADSFDFVSKRLEKFEFSPYTKLAEFHIRRALGWCNANRGNHLGAFREFRQSADAAPSTPWRIIAILDRALLARELKEHHSAQEELDYALRLCKSVDWQATRDEERNALFMLAQHLAPIDAVEARRLLDRHASIAAPLPVTSFSNKDRRLFADLAFATAQVLRAEGELASATRALLDCYDIWTQIGYTARAASAAADLAELTQNGHYFEIASREAEKRPNSWFANRLRSIAELTPA